VVGLGNHNVETIRHFTRFIRQNFEVSIRIPCSGQTIDRILAGVCFQIHDFRCVVKSRLKYKKMPRKSLKKDRKLRT